MKNIYLHQVHQNLPRLLALYNFDETSQTFGVGDRFYWAWKLIDFPNGTFQASAKGLSQLMKFGLLPDYIAPQLLVERIDAIFEGTQSILHNNGSLDEALPNEYSFCVTGLVAGDLLATIENLADIVGSEKLNKWISIVRPMIGFLNKQDEYHGVISNHLATNAVALVRWGDLTGEDYETRAYTWIKRILDNQSGEGWFCEYGGPDFGYQTWCTSSLLEVSKRRPKWNLEEPLLNSIGFLAFGAFPNGMFGGVTGSRMTEFVFPSGVSKLSNKSLLASRLADFFVDSIDKKLCVTLDSIDMGNFVPLFNDYVEAAVNYIEDSNFVSDVGTVELPYETTSFIKIHSDSGVLSVKKNGYYALINLRKGGVGNLCTRNRGFYEIPAFLGKDTKGKLVSNQLLSDTPKWSVEGSKITLNSEAYYVTRPNSSALKFLILRILSLTLFRSIKIGNLIKLILAKLLISLKREAQVKVVREIYLNDTLEIIESSCGAQPIESRNFRQIHMASMGYWCLNHENKKSLKIKGKNDAYETKTKA